VQATPPPAQPQAPVTASARKFFHEQFDNEQVILCLRKDFMFLIRSMLVEIVIFLGMVILVVLDVIFDLGLIEKNWFWIAWFVALVIIGFWAFIDWFNWRYDMYIITDRRIVDSTRRFPLNKKLAEAQLDRVQDTSYEKNGLFANIFDYGSIVIQTAGEADNFVWNGMPNPVEAQRIVRDAVERHLQQEAQGRSSRDGGLR
jgi:uncharacterized membrane protein YdbT with pleckstrin-like domain